MHLLRYHRFTAVKSSSSCSFDRVMKINLAARLSAKLLSIYLAGCHDPSGGRAGGPQQAVCVVVLQRLSVCPPTHPYGSISLNVNVACCKDPLHVP